MIPNTIFLYILPVILEFNEITLRINLYIAIPEIMSQERLMSKKSRHTQ